jgi:two-component system sensor histidine kinase HydH
MHERRVRTSWWSPGRDLQAFRLAKFFSLASFVVILVFNVILTLFLTLWSQRMALSKSEEYLKLLAANLNHQVFQQFLVPTAIEQQGRITIADPEQAKRLDEVVRNTIYGFNVDEMAIYDQLGVLAYSTTKQPLGKDCFDVPGVKTALYGEHYVERLGGGFLWDLLPRLGFGSKRLRAYFPFRLEGKPGASSGPVVGVFEITQDISRDLMEIGKFQGVILLTSTLIMGLLFLVLRQIVKQAEVILDRRERAQRQLEAQLNQAERLAALGEMTAGVAHEIRNPLGIISSTAELLKERLNRYEPNNRLAQIIVEEANRLNEKVSEFLDLARDRAPNLRPCQLDRVLERSLEFLQPEIDKRHIMVERRYPEDGTTQEADPDLLHQAFLNILLNAIQAMPAGGALKVAVTPGQNGRGSEILIQDSGEGIDPETMKKIFNPFFTTKEKGSGLGLPIVKSIIESHQGTIRIDSTPGQGTAVTITLPPLSPPEQG